MSSTQGVRDFYKNKNIFITGATGFLGLTLLEKILRTIPEHGTIYLLVRSKKGKDVSERLEQIKKNSIFEPLYKEKSEETLFAKVRVVSGDVGQENMGLSPEDRALLTANINVIFHCAATLDFGDDLKSTVNTNLLGTRRIAQMAVESPKLDVLVHVSSAYVNSFRLDADEVIYPVPHDIDEFIKLVTSRTKEEVDEQTPELLGDHPNTYTITKHMAEHEIQKIESKVPCTIVRPSMILGAWKEPIPGWTISKNGPPGFFMGAAKGVVRRLPVAKELIYDYIPCDIVINNLLSAGFHAAATKASKVEIYHATSSTRNPFCWASVEERINPMLHEYPTKGALWYPTLKLLPSVTWFKISAFFVHFLPAILLDSILRLQGRRPILVRLHTNINISLDRLSKFIFTQWKFTANNTQNLQKWLSDSDKVDFNVDISSLKWVEFFTSMVKGARVYLNNDPMKTLGSARNKDKILLGLHVVFQVLLFSLLWFIFACVFNMTLLESCWVLPLIYLLFSLL